MSNEVSVPMAMHDQTVQYGNTCHHLNDTYIIMLYIDDLHYSIYRGPYDEIESYQWKRVITTAFISVSIFSGCVTGS